MPATIAPEDLRTTIETLAAIDRPSASDGELRAAAWIADRFTELGCSVEVDDELAHRGYARSIAGQSALGAIGAALAASSRPARRAFGGLLALAAAAGVVEEVSNGPQLFRRVALRRKPTSNVLAFTGDLGAERTLVVLAHHDAAQTGLVFDQTGSRAFAARFPGVVERIDTSPPLWWPVAAGPLLGALGALTGRRGLARAGAGLAATSALAVGDIARSPSVPGANDNLSGVAALLAVAAALQQRPLQGLRVLLVSAGAEECLQGGIRAFAARRFPQLDPATTSVLNLDTIGSPFLVMLEGEGTFVMEDYTDPAFRDRVAAVAERHAIPLRRGLRTRTSTDSVIPSRAGYPTATLVSIDETKAIPHYHLPSDTPENVRYDTVADAATITVALARDLAAG